MTGHSVKPVPPSFFMAYFIKTTNPNPSPTGKKFGFVLFGTPEGTRLIKEWLGPALASGARPRRI